MWCSPPPVRLDFSPFFLSRLNGFQFLDAETRHFVFIDS